MEHRLSLLFLYLISDLRSLLCCQCFPSHIQTDYCAANIVTKVKIQDLARSESEKWLRYNANISTVFKGRETFLFSIPHKMEIGTPGPAHSCGVQYLKPGLEYLISGNRDERGLKANACSGVKFWTDIQAILLRNVDCSCKIFIPKTWNIPMKNEYPPKTDDICLAPTRGTCQFKSGVCKRDQRGVCQWNLVKPCPEKAP
ncbi:uncharacterized protein LOC134265678 [Saccostrea cucullata]|uniref:uncharacterized protein LOC134265678 n=1 Tax=Saccostrea cuccullata TaxID=36930 RepID=UPI002ED66B4A